MRRVTWRAVPAQLRTGMCEMKSWGLSFCGVSWIILGRWLRTGLHTCAVQLGELFRHMSKDESVN